jgi:hypothetical protein
MRIFNTAIHKIMDKSQINNDRRIIDSTTRDDKNYHGTPDIDV